MLILHILSVCSASVHSPSAGAKRAAKGIDNYNGENYSDAGSSLETELEGVARGDRPAKVIPEVAETRRNITASSRNKVSLRTGKASAADRPATDTSSGTLLKQGKDLIVEGLKKIEKSNAAGPAGDTGNAVQEQPRSKGNRRIIEKSSKIEISMPAHLLVGRKPPAAEAAGKSDGPPAGQPTALSGASPLATEGPMKKLTDLLFKSSIVTKNEIITEKESATLIENNIKIKSIMSQLQKIYDVNTGVLKKFLNGQGGQAMPYEAAEKPKDVMKYQVIEVTEKNK